MTEITPTGCCPPFDPAPWDDQIIEWSEKLFIKDKVFCILNMPVNFGQVMTRIMTKAYKSGITVPDALCLSHHTSKWNMDVYLAVDKEVANAENVKLSGKFFSKVYEGPFKDTDKWGEDFKATVAEKGLIIKKWYMWYTTCPKCAKKYGKNYVVIIGEVE